MTTGPEAAPIMIEMKLEVVMLPVADVDRSRDFYVNQLGFDLDVDHQPNDEFRVVQVTPPGSACSVIMGIGLDLGEPGDIKGTHLVVTDIEAAVAELADRGVSIQPIRHMSEAGWTDGPHPDRIDYGSFSGFADPDGNTWVLQEVGHPS